MPKKKFWKNSHLVKPKKFKKKNKEKKIRRIKHLLRLGKLLKKKKSQKATHRSTPAKLKNLKKKIE